MNEHVYVERGNAERLLDLHGGPGQVTTIHLPDERPLFLRSSDEQREALLDASNMRVTLLAPKPGTVLAKGARDRALTRLFDAPFDVSLVERWTREWKPAELSTLVVPGAPAAVSTGRVVAAVTMLSGLALAATGFAVGWERQQGFVELDQRARLARNELIVGMNVMGVGGLALSAVSAITWALLNWRW